MPYATAYEAELFHRVQHRLAHFHLNCSHTNGIRVRSVLLVNGSIDIRLQNRYS